jgi:hypothetical protein
MTDLGIGSIAGGMASRYAVREEIKAVAGGCFVEAVTIALGCALAFAVSQVILDALRKLYDEEQEMGL